MCPGNFRYIRVLWWINAPSDGNLDVVVLLTRRSEGGTNSFVTGDASIIKKRVGRVGQELPKRQVTVCVKLALAAPGNLCGQPVES